MRWIIAASRTVERRMPFVLFMVALPYCALFEQAGFRRGEEGGGECEQQKNRP